MADSGYPIGIISIHALREESDPWQRLVADVAGISIHALREESDRITPRDVHVDDGISIHALREESDRQSYRPWF